MAIKATSSRKGPKPEPGGTAVRCCMLTGGAQPPPHIKRHSRFASGLRSRMLINKAGIRAGPIQKLVPSLQIPIIPAVLAHLNIFGLILRLYLLTHRLKY